ncbi:MAG: hypothetical protein ACRBN8_43325 [Nannocystales bacterium]
MRPNTVLWGASVVLFGLLGGRTAAAAEREHRSNDGLPDEVAHAATVSARASALGFGAKFGYRARLRRGVGIGLEVEGLYDPEAVLGGYATERNGFVNARVPVFIPVLRSGTLTMAVLVAPGVRVGLAGDPGFGPDRSVAATLDTGVFAYLHVSRRLTWVLGVDTPLAVQVDPITDVSEIGTLLTTGPVVTVTPRLNVYAAVDAGGLFGSDGDAGKFLIRGTAGIRLHWGMNAADWTAY